MAEAWGAEFVCQKKRKNPHGGPFYFFDSKPESFPCPYCDDGTLMIRVRELDMGKTASRKTNEIKRRKAEKQT